MIKPKTKLILSLFFLVASLSFAAAWVGYTNELYSGLPVSTDALFKIIPFVNLSALSDLLSIFSPFLFLIFIFVKKTEKKIPYYAITIGIFYIIRSIFIYLTPLANPFPFEKWGTGLFPTGGMFPSGHTGFLFLMFLFAKENPGKKHWAVAFLIMTILEGMFLILSRGHYSMDVLGAIIITYALHAFSKKHLEKHLIL